MNSRNVQPEGQRGWPTDQQVQQALSVLEERANYVRDDGVADLEITRENSRLVLRRPRLGFETELLCLPSRRADGTGPHFFAEILTRAPIFNEPGVIEASAMINRVCTTAALVGTEAGGRQAFTRFLIPPPHPRWSFLWKWILDAAVIGPATVERCIRAVGDAAVWTHHVPDFENGWSIGALQSLAPTLEDRYSCQIEGESLVVDYSIPIRTSDQPLDASLRLFTISHPFWGPGCMTQLRFRPFVGTDALLNAPERLNALLFRHRLRLSSFGSWYLTDDGALVFGQFLAGNEHADESMLVYLATNAHDIAQACCAELFQRAGLEFLV